MNHADLIEILTGYLTELKGILGRFDKRSSSWGYHLDLEYQERVTGIIFEIRDLVNNGIPKAKQSSLDIIHAYNNNRGPGNSVTYKQVSSIITALESFITRVRRFPELLLASDEISTIQSPKTEILDRIAEKFHDFARQLRARYNERPPFEITDEYDVQDAFHAVLKIFFDDIRKEEQTPGFAGSSLRGDFYLPEIDTFVEIKKTRHGMTAKTLGEQLIIDITKYQAHPGCKRIVCFVYDPEGIVPNPAGMKKDLETREWNVEVFIKITP